MDTKSAPPFSSVRQSNSRKRAPEKMMIRVEPITVGSLMPIRRELMEALGDFHWQRKTALVRWDCDLWCLWIGFDS